MFHRIHRALRNTGTLSRSIAIADSLALDNPSHRALYPLEPSFHLPNTFLSTALSPDLSRYSALLREVSPEEVEEWNERVRGYLNEIECEVDMECVEGEGGARDAGDVGSVLEALIEKRY
jgi:hypothetical protein